MTSEAQSQAPTISSSPMGAHTRRTWQPRAEKSPAVGDFAPEGITPLQAHLLALRGIESAPQAHAFVHARLKELPDPVLLPDMDKAVARLLSAIRNGDQIAVHGDYDVDGVSATSVLYLALEHAGARVSYHIPLRLEDGYGLSAAALRDAAAAGVRVVVSVDCGISSMDDPTIPRE